MLKTKNIAYPENMWREAGFIPSDIEGDDVTDWYHKGLLPWRAYVSLDLTEGGYLRTHDNFKIVIPPLDPLFLVGGSKPNDYSEDDYNLFDWIIDKDFSPNKLKTPQECANMLRGMIKNILIENVFRENRGELFNSILNDLLEDKL